MFNKMEIVKTYLERKGWSLDQIRCFRYVIESFFKINWLKTIYVNFKYLPYRQALRFPIIIGNNVIFKNKGQIVLENAYLGMISIGVLMIKGWECSADGPTMITNSGKMKFYGRVKVHPGARLCVSRKGSFQMGNRVSIGSHTKVVCRHRIVFGSDVQISWHSQVFDTDFHFLTNITKNKTYSRCKPVILEDEVFVGNSCTIGKGTYLPKGSVVSCCSKVTGDFRPEGENLLIIGNPAKTAGKGFKMGNGWFPEIEKEMAKEFES